MDQLGAIFKETREKQGKTLEDAVKETKIAKKYLIAIENENFDIFPGETYLIGFIRNYAQFLGLNPDEMIQRYKSYKIQEQPTPIEQLTARPRKTKYIVMLAAILGIIAISVVSYTILNKKNAITVKEEKTIKKVEAVEKKEPVTSKEYITMEESELIRDFTEGDVIRIPFNNKSYNLKIDKVGNGMDFTVDKIPFTMEKDEIVEIDFNKDGKKDIFMKINNIQGNVVNVTLKRIFKTSTNIAELPSSGSESAKISLSNSAPEVVIFKESELNKIPKAPIGGFTIISGYEKTGINTKITADKLSYVGFFKDKEAKDERLLQPGDSLDINAKDQLILMIANARGVKVSVNNIPLSNVLNNSAIVVKMIKWYRDRENADMYDLVMHDVKNPENKINYGE